MMAAHLANSSTGQLHLTIIFSKSRQFPCPYHISLHLRLCHLARDTQQEIEYNDDTFLFSFL
jgi:hypothetical protein